MHRKRGKERRRRGSRDNEGEEETWLWILRKSGDVVEEKR